MSSFGIVGHQNTAVLYIADVKSFLNNPMDTQWSVLLTLTSLINVQCTLI